MVGGGLDDMVKETVVAEGELIVKWGLGESIAAQLDVLKHPLMSSGSWESGCS